MADLMTGKLIYKGEGKNRKRYVVFTTKKGGTWDAPINPDLLSQSLRANTEAEVEVAFELDNSGRPVRVRAVGEEWKEIAPPASAPRRMGDRRRDEPGRRDDRRRDDRRTDQRPQPQTERRSQRPNLPGDFHNPYNFIPTPPRPPKTDTDLDDKEPVSHDSYHADRWSGRIAVKLTTHTPLLVPDAAQATKDANDHKTYPTRLDVEGRKPYIPPTSIKGMLRAAYEAVTNSRMAVFTRHKEPLAYRMPAQRNTMGVPARVEVVGDKLVFRFMQAKSLRSYLSHEQWRNNRGLTNDSKKKKGADIIAAERKYPNGRLPEHGQSVWVLCSNSWADDWRPGDAQQPSTAWVKGWACVTGANIRDKRCERIFVEDETKKPIQIEGDEKKRVEALWRNLIVSYQQEHKRDLEKRSKRRGSPKAWDYLGQNPGDTAWSRHVYTEADSELKDGTLCYVEANGGEITAVFPVAISRRLYEVSPERLLDDSIKPAEYFDHLSPADRVFGWVKQGGEGKSRAYRGNLRISQVTCTSADPLDQFGNDGLPLAILGQPKPQQARFYVAKTKQHCEKQDDQISKDDAGYRLTKPEKGLRGRKVYPHHAGSLQAEGYWENPLEDRTQKGIQTANGTFFQEYRRPYKGDPEGDVHLIPMSGATAFKTLYGKEQRDDQNRSIRSWIKPRTQFTFEIDVTNLSDFELGALLWLLSMNADELTAKYFHRLGSGKPLGFGSVTLEINWGQTRLSRGSGWQDFYASFDHDEPTQIMNDQGASCIQRFRDDVAKAYGKSKFEEVAFIAAFLSCAAGFNAPIHYPRARPKPSQWKEGAAVPPHPEGRAYEWFVQNEHVSLKYAFALPDLKLGGSAGLPILDIAETAPRSKGNKQGKKKSQNRPYQSYR